MSEKNTKDFFEMLAVNNELKGEITDSAHLIYVEAGKKHGYDFTVQDLCEFMNKDNARQVLSDEDLENVAGGGRWFDFWFGSTSSGGYS